MVFAPSHSIGITAVNISQFEEALVAVEAFIGPEWLKKECDGAGPIPDPKTAHPFIYAWLQVSRYLTGFRLPELDTVPRQQLLHLMMLGGHTQNVKEGKVVDASNCPMNLTLAQLYRKRLQTPVMYHNAVYELQVAGAHVRKGCNVSFIHDDLAKTPEFQVEIGKRRVFVECKRLGRKDIDESTSNVLTQVANKTIGILRKDRDGMGIVLVVDDKLRCGLSDLMTRIKKLIDLGERTAEDKWPGHALKKVSRPPPTCIAAIGKRYDIAYQTYYDGILLPCLRSHLEGATILRDKFEHSVRTVSDSQQRWVAERGFFAGFKQMRNTISGIESALKKATGQLPKNAPGIVYVECPPYDAIDDEISDFKKALCRRLNSSSRIMALVLTGTIQEFAKTQYFSNIIHNEFCVQSVPSGFEVIPLMETFTCS